MSNIVKILILLDLDLQVNELVVVVPYCVLTEVIIEVIVFIKHDKVRVINVCINYDFNKIVINKEN